MSRPLQYTSGQAVLAKNDLWMEEKHSLPDRIGKIRISELTLVFQPQMSADGSAIVCAEALLRHDHPSRGRLSPAHFMTNFNTRALREELDWWVLENACKHLLLWPDISVSINMSATQFRRPDFARRVLDLIAKVAAEPQRIEIEILESAFIKDFDAAITNINTLRAGKVRVALDDFGTGFSSLTYLLRLPIDKLKIDRSFTGQVEFVQSAAIVQAITAMARALGLKVTAEGVETVAQHQALRAMGCHYMQGYLFSPPVAGDVIAQMIDQQRKTQLRDLDTIRKGHIS
jgi:EAL domain-containing protein (putative c-di-GMP-specific phosphodiesterase class I)